MTDQLSPALTMNDGRSIPQVGLGVYKVADDQADVVVREALQLGYRHIDTAALYRNEAGVGRGLRESGLPRENVFVTTKVWNDRHGYEETLAAFSESLDRLGLEYVDLYLIHWPAPRQNRYIDTWRALEKIAADGLARSIGVSNFAQHHLERLLTETEVTPALNQIELHPWLSQDRLREFNAAHGILTEAWSPLARGRVLGNDVIDRIAAKYDKSPAQVVLRWHLELGNVVIPKSVTPARIAENFAVFDFALDYDDLGDIAGLNTGERTGADPDELD